MYFNRKKYILLVTALILLTLGFVLMSGPKGNQPDQFDEQIFSFRRITLAPILILGTYISLIFVILKQEKKHVQKKNEH